MNSIVGIDISKATLDVHRSDGKEVSFKNNLAGSYASTRSRVEANMPFSFMPFYASIPSQGWRPACRSRRSSLCVG